MAFTSRHSTASTSIPSTSSQFNQAFRTSFDPLGKHILPSCTQGMWSPTSKAMDSTVEEVDPTTWRLLNPLCGIKGLFYEADPPIMGTTLDPSNYHIKELARSYSVVDDHSEDERLEKKASKVIPLSGCNKFMNQLEEVKLLAMDWDRKLYFWQQGDAYWTRVLDDNQHGFEDIVSCRGKFYAADELGTFFEIDPSKSGKEDEFSRIISAPDIIPKKDSDYDKHLLMGEYNGKVHLVLRPEENIMRTYVLEDGPGGEAHKWNTVDSLNNNVLFILNEVSFCLHPTVLEREFEGGWICFVADDAGETYRVDCSDDSYLKGLNGLKSLAYPCYFDHFAKGIVKENEMGENVTSFYSLSDHEYVSLFFPPPPWIQYYALDADKGNPPVWFDKCSLPKYEFF
ncbi:F-box protein SKIP23-like [Silene latifolia]|uniref:F-box protein SKIP23-like n=1 Tax=Silene latifolia TaxID=37657 RepID=UPI003D77772E